jgi:hypothetical protein
VCAGCAPRLESGLGHLILSLSGGRKRPGKERRNVETKNPSTLELQVSEHLTHLAKDDLLYPKIFSAHEGLLVVLLPYEFECGSCRDKGYAPRLVEAFRLGIRPTWCEECRAESHFRRERHEGLNARLLDFLERRFIVDAEQPHRGHVVLSQRTDFIPVRRGGPIVNRSSGRNGGRC